MHFFKLYYPVYFSIVIASVEEDLACKEPELDRRDRLGRLGNRFPNGTNDEDVQRQNSQCRDGQVDSPILRSIGQ